ncbi:ergothioneine biosynthesis protein EgtB [Membranihabitans marinus]|uniref:ergothioneine biosynthesis protein EgtB n=1 Tax=Membranihabitans marinus TaxID=1227546 RepID=UPI001F02D20C|nr:ergothioneine biosynthesis protein EgtB [Membranihabitans marinus]
MTTNTFYDRIRARTEAICSPLSSEDYVVQVVEFTSPAKWHLGHTTWFFEAFILNKYLDNYREFHPDFAFLFNSYYQTMGERLLRVRRGFMTRPPVEQIYEYRDYVNRHMRKLMDNDHLSDEVRDLIVLGCHHEQQHQELLWTDIKYMLGHQSIFPAYDKTTSLATTYNSETGWLEHPGGVVDIGHKGEEFCYDNELGKHQVYLHPFSISKALVTNGEYIEFIEAGGYKNPDLWLDDGWTWLQTEKISQPMYWHKKGEEWLQYTLKGLLPIDQKAQLCHISQYEASAYAEWKNLRLPTEFEWEAAADELNWGQRWEWTNSAYLPYPFFEKAPGAVGEYNGKFMSNQLVLKGQSVATSDNHSRKTYRNFFKPQMQWQYSGIRLATYLK